LLPGLPPGSAVVADRSYDSRLVHALIEAARAQPQIPTPRRRRVQRSVDPALYRRRNLVERFFNKLKHFPANSHALRENRP
jgi:transposase